MAQQKKRTKCPGRLEFRNIGGMLVYTAGPRGGNKRYDFRCPSCGDSGETPRLRQICGKLS